MNRPTFLFALIGAAVGALAFPLAVGPFWILTGVWLALAIGIASLIAGRRSLLAWWQYSLIVALCPLAYAIVQPVIWKAVASRTHSEVLQTWLGGMAGLILSDAAIAFGLRWIVGKSVARRGMLSFWVVAALLGVLHVSVALIWRAVGASGLPAWSHLAFDLVVAFSILCGYVGYLLLPTSSRMERADAPVGAAARTRA